MKHLKKYKSFIESAIIPTDPELKPNDTDSPDMKLSKEKLATMREQLTEYKNKKILIDNLYATQKDPKIIETELTKIIGVGTDKTTTSSGFDLESHRNPFLVEYSHISKLSNDITTMQKDNVTDKIKRDDFQQELRDADNEGKVVINAKISEIDKRMATRVNDINKLQSEIMENTKDHNNRMKDIKDYIDDNIDKI